jgi:hypothetical protein
MTKFSVSWNAGRREKFVETISELDFVLDQIERERSDNGLPFMVDVTSTEANYQGFPVGLHMSVGHPVRARVDWAGPPKPSTAVDPGVPPWEGEAIAFDYGGLPTEEDTESLRVTPETARQAAREYVTTGQRPTCVGWE